MFLEVCMYVCRGGSKGGPGWAQAHPIKVLKKNFFGIIFIVNSLYKPKITNMKHVHASIISQLTTTSCYKAC